MRARIHVVALVALCIGLVSGLLFIPPSQSVYAAGQTYYVNAVNGSDFNSGTTESQAWKSLSKVNGTTFQPGDRILFRSGDTWSGQLHPLGSGSSSLPIRIDKYGSGDLPIIDGGGTADDAVYLHNQSYWEISNLEIVNNAASQGPRLGVHVVAQDAGQVSHIVLKQLYIHDIAGQTGVRNTGGILFDVQGSSVVTWFHDILVEDCTLERVTRTGIATYSKWMNRNGFTGGTGPWKGWTNIVIRGNSLDVIGGDGILIRNGIGALIEYNVVRGANDNRTTYNAGIWPFLSDDTVIQFNEAYLTRTTMDGQGFDADYHCSGTLIQYNYSHDNEGGFLLVMGPGYGPNSDVVARYNISKNDKTRIVQFVQGVASNFKFYNNTIYVGSGIGTTLVVGSTSTAHDFSNNLFYMLSGGIGTLASGANFDHNTYYPIAAAAGDANAVTANPLLASPGSGGVGRSTLDGYKLQTNSPLIDAGAAITGNGGYDFWGNTLDQGAPDIGAYESDGTAPSSQPSGAELFNDNFEDGNTTGWTLSGGTWNVVTDGSKTLKRTSSGSVESIALAGDTSWKNYTYQAKVKLDTSAGSSGLLFRAADANNFYMFRFNDANNHYELYKKVSGTMTLVDSGAFSVNLGQWYTLKAVVEGNRIKGFIDGVLKSDWTNPNTELTAGKIGFRTHDVASLDDAVVNPAYSDDFEDGNTTGWTLSGGTWNVVTDGSKVLKRTSSSSVESIALAGDAGWKNYTYQAEVKLDTSGGSSGLLFRAADANNFYMFRFNDANNHYELYKKVSGTMTLVDSGAFTVNLGQWYTLKVTVDGNRIKGYIDGALKSDWTNPNSELTTGRIGFRTHDVASLDDVVMY